MHLHSALRLTPAVVQTTIIQRTKKSSAVIFAGDQMPVSSRYVLNTHALARLRAA
jgi:hypothetical protein